MDGSGVVDSSVSNQKNPILVDDFVSSFDRYLWRKFFKGSGVVDSSVSNQKNPILVDDFCVVI